MSGWDHSLHMSSEFADERAFCPCGEELVFQQEFDATKCLKCIQEEQAKERVDEEGKFARKDRAVVYFLIE